MFKLYLFQRLPHQSELDTQFIQIFGRILRKLLRDFDEKSSSSTVVFAPGLLQDMHLSTNLFHTSETKVNLSVGKRTDLVLRTLKRKNCRISQKQFLLIVSEKMTPLTAYFKSCLKEYSSLRMISSHKLML